MSSDPSTGDRLTVQIVINRRELAGPVLERLVSAAAARAELTVDRMINALSVVDALVDAADRALAGDTRCFSVSASPGELRIDIAGLLDGEAESVVEAANLPALGNVLTRLTSKMSISNDGDKTSIRIALA
ncbi:MAG: hypothetical protein WAO61_04780 [Solirubrobacterales bacterium]